jgi:hypothetical protein
MGQRTQKAPVETTFCSRGGSSARGKGAWSGGRARGGCLWQLMLRNLRPRPSSSVARSYTLFYVFIPFLAFYLAFLGLVWLSHFFWHFAFFWLFWHISTENVLIKRIQTKKKNNQKK